MSEYWSREIPSCAPAWVGPLSRKMDQVFAERADMIDSTQSPLPKIRVLLPARHYDDLERSMGGFPSRGPERPRFRGCDLIRTFAVMAPTVDITGKMAG